MALAENDGVRLFFEDSGGDGAPILFLHEYAGDHRSWVGQMKALSGKHRCLAAAARGYPPSDCPDAPEAYTQEAMNSDALAVLDAAQVEKAHIVGLSMGAFTALQLAQFHPQRILSITAAAGGSGSAEDRLAQEGFVSEALGLAALMEKTQAMPAEAMCKGPTRIHLLSKNAQAWQLSVNHLASHPWEPAANMLRGVQVGRPSLREQEDKLRDVSVPVQLMVGDEDISCLNVNIWLKQIMGCARLVVFPASGHALNLEEPELFNSCVRQFLSLVDGGRWQPRNPATMPKSGVHTALGLAEDGDASGP